MTSDVGAVPGPADWTAGTPARTSRAKTGAAGTMTARDEEFRRLFDSHFGQLAGYCAGLVGDRELAHDIAQEAFTRLLSRWVHVREPRAYVFMVATNLARRQWSRRELERAALAHVAADDAPAAEHDPWLRDLVDRLPSHLREMVLLHYFADLPVSEVARLLHRPVGTVKRRMHDARRLLQDAIEESR